MAREHRRSGRNRDKTYGKSERNVSFDSHIDQPKLKLISHRFRWVKCQLDILEYCLHYPALKKALNSLPRDLHDTYARILDSVDNLKKPWTIRILQFLAYSERPLTLDEMVDALAVEPDAKEQDLSKNRMPFPDEIAGYTSTLVNLVVRETEQGSVKELQLAHFSVKEYLTSDKVCETLQEAHAKSDMTNVCLGYLLHLSQRMPVEYIRKTFPFAQFCARYWMEYAVVAEMRDETAEKIRKLANEFFISKGSSLNNCYRLYDPDWPETAEPGDDDSDSDDDEPAHPLYYTSLGGLPISTKALLDRKADVNEKGGRFGNALMAASYNGHLEIVQQLLDGGADVNATELEFSNALSAASSRGHEEVVMLLLNSGADIHTTGQHNQYGALHAASSEGHEEIVRLLLDHCADVNTEMELHGSALQVAASEGKKEVVRLLLERGADVNAKGGYFGGALQSASHNGHKEVIRLLLDCGADVNSGKYLTPLLCASQGGRGDVVELLIAEGADIHFCSQAYGNAVYMASENGHASVVEALLRRKVNPNVPGENYNNALQAALCEGHVQVAKLLLEKGIRFDGNEDRAMRLIQSAITRAYAEAVRMLVENIARPDGGSYTRDNILNAVNVGFQIMSVMFDKLIGGPRWPWGAWNERTRETLIACIDGNIGM